MRMHLPPSLSPAIAAREDALRERGRQAEAREVHVARRERRLAFLEAELRSAAIALRDLEGEVRTRGTRLTGLRDCALQMQRAFGQAEPKVGPPREGESTMRRESA